MKRLKIALLVFLVLTMFSIVLADDLPPISDTYSVADIEVVNNIIGNNGWDLPIWAGYFPGSSGKGWGIDKYDTNPLIRWDESTPKRIVELYVFGKNLTGSLDISGLTKLEKLSCNKNELTGIVFGNQPNLWNLNCADNNISSLDLSKLTGLENFSCANNKLSELDFSGIDTLKSLTCDNNLIKKLDLTDQENLTHIACSNNGLTELKLDGLKKLGNVECVNNNLTELVIANNNLLSQVYCQNNLLTSIDVTGMTNLMQLNCSDNKLTEFIGDYIFKIEVLQINNNELEHLDISKLNSSVKLYCSNNNLTSLILHSNTFSNYMDVRNNYLEKDGIITDKSIPWDTDDFYFTPQKEGAPITKYDVTVINGTGSGKYIEGATVSITADAAPIGKQFKEWEVKAGNVNLTDTKSETTTFAMPAQAVKIEALYEDIPPVKYVVAVTNGSGGGEYEEGEEVKIIADEAPTGQQFKEWEVKAGNVNLTDTKNDTTTFAMPAQAVEIEALYEDIPPVKYVVTVTSGSGGGEYEEGKTITITADTAPTGRQFKEWQVKAGNVNLKDAKSDTTIFIMPSEAVTVEAIFEDISQPPQPPQPPVIPEPEPEPEPPPPPPLVNETIVEGETEVFRVKASQTLADQVKKAKLEGATDLQLDLTEELPQENDDLPLDFIIPKEVLTAFSQLDLNLVTPKANLFLPVSTLESLIASGGSLAIRVELSERRAEDFGLEEYHNLLTEPVDIETETKGSVFVTLFCNLVLPEEQIEREEFLSSLYIRAIHGQDDIEDIEALDYRLDETERILLSVTFKVDRFSTFALAIKGQAPLKPVLSSKIGSSTYDFGDENYDFDNLIFYRYRSDTTMMAVRLLEKLGAKIEYYRLDSVGHVSLEYDDVKLELQEGSMVLKNISSSEEISLNAPIENVKGRIYLPTRVIAETLGFNVEWQRTEDVVTINPNK